MIRNIFVAALLLVPVSLCAGELYYGGLVFESGADGCCTLTSGAGATGDVIVPQTVEGFTVTAIAPSAFIDNLALTSISLPATIKEIGSDAFRRCAYLKHADIPSVDAWLAISFADEFASPLCNYASLGIGGETLLSLEIPEGITEVRPYAFFNCESLQTVKLGADVESVGRSAFDGCENIYNVELSPKLREIGVSSFSICHQLREISFPEGFETLGNGCFYGCSSLQSVSLPSTLSEIPPLAFAGCASLTDLDFIPSGVFLIGDYAFHFCNGLTRVNLPDNISEIGAYAFNQCESLESVTIANSSAYLSDYIFSECPSLKSVVLPTEITEIPKGIFANCTSLTTVEIPGNVTQICDYAFAYCLALPYVTFPQKLKTIGDLAFIGCRALRTLEFPERTERIGTEAFYECWSLKEIHCRPVNPISISFFTFDAHADANAEVYVPEVAADSYLSIMGWANFSHFIPSVAYNPPSMLDIRYGAGGTVSRYVAYGESVTLRLAAHDGSLPARVEFNGCDVTAQLSADGSYTTPPVTEASTLVIF